MKESERNRERPFKDPLQPCSLNSVFVVGVARMLGTEEVNFLPFSHSIVIEKHRINFKKMTCDSYPLRRLSTPSFVE